MALPPIPTPWEPKFQIQTHQGPKHDSISHMQRYLEPNSMVPRGELLWQNDLLLTGGLRTRTYAVLEGLQRVIRRCQNKLEPRRSFEIIRVNKQVSVTALPTSCRNLPPHRSTPSHALPITNPGRPTAAGPFTIRRKPVPRPSPPHRAQPALLPPTGGQMTLTPSPHHAPHRQSTPLVTSKQGVIGNEYQSIHRPPQSACLPRRLQSPTQASLARAGPHTQQVSVDTRATTNHYVPFRPRNDTNRPRDHVRSTPGTNSQVPRGTMPAPRVSEQGLAGLGPVTTPKPPSRARAPSSIPVPTRRQGQGALAAPPARATPPQITITAPTPGACGSGPAAARDDDRLTLPTQQRQWKRRGAVVGMAAALPTQPKIASGTQPGVARRAVAVSRQQASPPRPQQQQQRQQQALRRRPGSRSLREDAAGECYTTGGSLLARRA